MAEEPTSFGEAIRAMTPPVKTFAIGTVKSVNEVDWTCVITPEDGGQDLVDVPIKIMRAGASAGFIVVPKIGAEVIVGWLGETRATLLKVQSWTKIIFRSDNDFALVMDASGAMTLGTVASAIHPVAWGDAILDFLNTFVAAYNSHTHGAPPVTPPPTTTVTAPGDLFGDEVKVS